MRQIKTIALIPLVIFVHGEIPQFIALAIQLTASFIYTSHLIKRNREMDKLLKFNEKLLDETFKTWYDSRPEKVKELCQQLPFEVYRIAANAPYKISSPGTIVHLRSFHENGEVSVIVLPQDLRDDAKEHIMTVMKEHNRQDKYEEAIKTPVAAVIDPKYLEVLTQEEYDKHMIDNPLV